MIVTMNKVFIVAADRDRDHLLAALQRLGVVHLTPVDAARAVAEEATVSAMDRLNRAIQILENTRPAGTPVQMDPLAAAGEVLRIQRESSERNNRLAALHLQMEQLALWGDVRLEQFAALRQAGVRVEFYAVPRKAVGEVRAECVQPLGPWAGKKTLVALIQRGGEATLPAGSEPVPVPTRDRPTIRAEAARLDAAQKADVAQLAGLVHLAGAMQTARTKLRADALWTVATRSALADPNLYALQGWAPVDLATTLAADLRAAGVETAVQTTPPCPDDQPPTLVKYAWWARPMKGLFDMLGTVPGYGEFDVSAAFMIFLPIFSAILISDAGYGLLYFLLPLVLYRRMKAAGAAELAQLILFVGLLSLVWGVVTCSFFGFNISGWFGRDRPWIAVDMKADSMNLLMYLSVTFGAIHLSLAHLWKAKAAFPRLNFVSEVGWAIWLWGMYGGVKFFLLNDPFAWDALPYYPYLLIVGGALAILFASPNRNPLKMFGLGLANFPLSAIGTFGDTVSYVRLMAIGLGGSALAVTFNQMGEALPIYGTIPVLMLGHALNVALSVVSLLAHGVRLNMLEFSNNLGMQWSGYAYEPFSKNRSQES